MIGGVHIRTQVQQRFHDVKLLAEALKASADDLEKAKQSINAGIQERQVLLNDLRNKNSELARFKRIPITETMGVLHCGSVVAQ